MLIVEYRHTICPHCGAPESKIIETWRTNTNTMRKHRCHGCGQEFASRDRYVTKRSTANERKRHA